MANKINSKFNSTPGYGYNLTRTSYDEYQIINSRVIGVLKQNNDIRKSLLQKNLSNRYVSMTSDEGIGYITSLFPINSKPLYSDEEGLLEFTHITSSDYQNLINKRYDIGDLITYYQHGNLDTVNSLKWKGLYEDYTKYIGEVFGFSNDIIKVMSNMFKNAKLQDGLGINTDEQSFLEVQTILNDFLRYDNIKYAMESTRIGTVTPNPLGALAGAVTTNINNFSGTDTPLGLITNYFYANTLRNSAQFNSLRNTKYITPEAYIRIGNKLSNLSIIGTNFKINDDTGRISFDISEYYGTKEFDELSEIEKLEIDGKTDLANTNNAKYKNIIVNKYKPLKSEKNTYRNSIIGDKLIDFDPKTGYKTLYIWNEGENVDGNQDFSYSTNETNYSVIKDSDISVGGLLLKTQELFTRHDETGIDTLIGRYHSTGGRDKTHNEASLMQTAISSFGLSHGRNLLNKKASLNGFVEKDKNSGYTNPYCRTWTYHNQYSKINDLIRPFSDESGNVLDIADDIQFNWWMYGRTKDGATRLKDNSVINKNGFVNITPQESKKNGKYDVTKCMFSIENLAWKDVTNSADKKILSEEQIGPNGGRIMWFPPYDLKFNETVGVNWRDNSFIGRGEKIYTYVNTERSGTLSFSLLVDHPSVLNMWKKNGASGDVEKDEQSLLRFFAGCDVLELNNKPIIENEEIQEEEPEDEPIITPEPETSIDDVIFYIFFPNYYTGINDNYESAVDYLKKYETRNWKDAIDIAEKENEKWGYKVDDAYKDKNLNYPKNYTDEKTLNLNENLGSVKSKYSDATTTFCNVESFLGDNIIITGATVQGFASNHGHENENISLIKNRAKFAKEFVNNLCSGLKDSIKDVEGSVISVDTHDAKNISGNSAKYARCAKVVLKCEKLNPIVDSSEIREGYQNNFMTNDGIDKAFTYSSNSQQQNTSTSNETDGRKINEMPIRVVNAKHYASVAKEHLDETRYEDEAEYFEMLKDNDSFLYSKLIDKIKYFSPAFHSITPEGFNARLSFLHQCTRQGHTISSSEQEGDKAKNGNFYKSAGNLSFGRPPVCVLRIGDFYNTKIIIENIQINYDNNGTQWDMNTEGIGMQPLFAQVTLSFKFLGGSDLSAPISRLQNAVSFNYYANQSVYDNRADVGYYENRTPKIKGTPWNPVNNSNK